VFYRPLGPEELEAKLQNWTPGKESGIWLHVSIVLALCPGVTGADFVSYVKDWYCKNPVLRGFYVHEVRRKVHSVFIFDRLKAQQLQLCEESSWKCPEAPDIRMWILFFRCFGAKFYTDREAFYEEVFELRQNRRVTYTWAEALFGITESRLRPVPATFLLIR
jgi:hypothetical protein